MATDAPQLFYEDPDIIHNRLVSSYSAEVDRPVLDSQPESMVFRTIAMEIALLRAQSDAGVASMLARFSTGAMLTYIAENTGVVKLGAVPAVTTLRFVLTPGHGTVTLPAGTKVRTTDGLMVFATDEEKSAAPGVNSITVTATALTDGPQGNLYLPGLVSDIIDPYPFVASASNTVITGGGADVETDDGLRRRILISQNQYSTAGSADSYRYWALSANPSIIDVAVVNEKDINGKPIAATVKLYPLVTGGGATPQAILDAVLETLSAKTRRPLNDIVTAESPSPVNYNIPLELVLKEGAVQSTTENAVIAAITSYVTEQSKKLGADVTESQIKAAGMNGSVHSLKLPGFTDLIVGPTEFGCGLYDFIDYPINAAGPLIVREIRNAVARWEDRAAISDVSYQIVEGNLRFNLTLIPNFNRRTDPLSSVFVSFELDIKSGTIYLIDQYGYRITVNGKQLTITR